MRRGLVVLVLSMVVTMLMSIPALAAPGSTDAETARQLALVRQITAKYQNVDAAVADGYISLEACVEAPGVGGMGVHYLNEAYFGQALATQSADFTQPVALLYEPRGNGLKLVGVEYFYPIVLTGTGETWWGNALPNEAIEPAPTLFGQQFDGPMPGHEPGMPAHYDMHVWLWQASPDGMFTTWNRNVDCPA